MESIFQPRDILFIKDYQFEDGGESKDKIAIILDCNEEEVWLIQALVTSQDKVPNENLNHGCTNNKENFLSFYLFLAEREIAIDPKGQPFHFQKNTFIYFAQNVKQLPLDKYSDYTDGKVEAKAVLNESEYKRLIKCIKKSHLIPRKIKRLFEARFP